MTQHRETSILETREVAKTALFHIERRLIRFPSGAERWLERLRDVRAQTVLIVPLVQPDMVMLVREYCAGSHSYELKFPTGTVEPPEDVHSAANRELKEELGFGAGRMSDVKMLKSLPGHSDNVTHVVLAENLFREKLTADEPETLESMSWRISESNALLQLADFAEARSVAALLLVDRFLRDRLGTDVA